MGGASLVDKVVDMVAKMVAEMEVDIVADTEVDMDMVADMEVDKVADMPEWLNMARKKVPQSARVSAGGYPIAIWAMPKCRGRQFKRVLPHTLFLCCFEGLFSIFVCNRQ